MKIKFVLSAFLAFYVFIGISQQTVFIGDSGTVEVGEYDLEGNLIQLLDDDVNTPRGITSDKNFLFYLNKDRGELIRYDLVMEEKTVIIDDLEDPRDVVAIFEDEYLIVTEYTGKISRVDYDGSNYSILTEDIQEPLFMTYDRLAGKLFVTNRADIYSLNLDGTEIQAMPGSFDDPIAIEVDPRSRLIYFSERGSTYQVSTMQYDGSERQVLFNSTLLFSYFDLHCEEDRMYYTANFDDRFGYFSLDGSTVEGVDFGISVSGLDLRMNDCETSSVKATLENSALTFSPNPSDGTISFNSETGFSRYEILDINGRTIKNASMNPSMRSLKLNVRAGTYFIKLFSEEKVKLGRVVIL